MKPRLSDGQSVFLDLVRGLSAVAVMVGHTVSYIPNPPLFGTLYPVQSYAVVIFFVLSGFLICLSTLSKENYSYGAYLIDRFARVYTALVPTLLLIIVVDSFVGFAPQEGWDLKTFGANLMMIMGIPFDRVHYALPYFRPLGTGAPLWTVAVEWWLYVAFGFIVFLHKFRLRSGLVALVLTPIAFLVVVHYGARESLALVWFASAAVAIPVLRLDAKACRAVGPSLVLFWGILAFWRFLVMRSGVIDSDGVPIGALNFYDPHFMYFSTAVIFGALLCVKGFAVLDRIMLAIRPVARFLADISYSLYLTHLTLVVGYIKLIGISWFHACVIMVLTTLFAWVFTKLFDQQYRNVARFLKRVLLGQTATGAKSLREQTQAAVDVEMSEEARRNAEDGVAPA